MSLKSYRNLSLIACAHFVLAGCSSITNSVQPTLGSIQSNRVYEEPTPQKEAIFKQEMIRVALSTKNNPRYRKLSLDTTEKKEWFKRLLYRLWDRQITRSEFIREGLKRYPDRRYEFTFIANGFQTGCAQD